MEGGPQHAQLARGVLQGWLELTAAHLSDAPPAVARVLLSSLTGLLVIGLSRGDEQGTDEGDEALKELVLDAAYL